MAGSLRKHAVTVQGDRMTNFRLFQFNEIDLLLFSLSAHLLLHWFPTQQFIKLPRGAF